jgi:hypothetical protein
LSKKVLFDFGHEFQASFCENSAGNWKINQTNCRNYVSLRLTAAKAQKKVHERETIFLAMSTGLPTFTLTFKIFHLVGCQNRQANVLQLLSKNGT